MRESDPSVVSASARFRTKTNFAVAIKVECMKELYLNGTVILALVVHGSCLGCCYANVYQPVLKIFPLRCLNSQNEQKDDEITKHWFYPQWRLKKTKRKSSVIQCNKTSSSPAACHCDVCPPVWDHSTHKCVLLPRCWRQRMLIHSDSFVLSWYSA